VSRRRKTLTLSWLSDSVHQLEVGVTATLLLQSSAQEAEAAIVLGFELLLHHFVLDRLLLALPRSRVVIVALLLLDEVHVVFVENYLLNLISWQHLLMDLVVARHLLTQLKEVKHAMKESRLALDRRFFSGFVCERALRPSALGSAGQLLLRCLLYVDFERLETFTELADL